MKHAKPKESHVKQYAAVAALASTGALPIITAVPASAATVDAWDKVAQCESGQRWNLSWGDASSTGGLQIQKGTWDDYKAGISTAAYPYQTSKQTQIAVAEKILHGQGPSAWTCNAMVGSPLQRSGVNASQYDGGATPYAAVPQGLTPAPVASHTKTPTEGKSVGANRVHVVVQGDWLSKIALHEYGKADRWHAIYAANKRVIGSDPNLIFPGQRLKLPGTPVAKPVQKPDTSDTKSHSSWVHPCAYPVTQGFMNPSGGYTLGYHTGVDLGAPHGTPVLSPGNGVVVASDTASAYGNNVQIKFSDGRYGLFAHLSLKSVSVGQTVTPGQHIGNVGNTGTNSSGPHLHFEIRIVPNFGAGNFLDPIKWLKGHGVQA